MSLKQPVVCQIVGCANVGKTKLLAAYSGINVLSAVDMNGFPIKSQPYEYGMAIARGIIDENGQPTHISIWDAPLGNEKLRPLTLTKADVVLLCYSTDAIITLHTACQEARCLLVQLAVVFVLNLVIHEDATLRHCQVCQCGFHWPSTFSPSMCCGSGMLS
eukprot:TRINITY_DN8865_c0_g1_i3.p2 TRINITY_DN8865_c0_g1~~TRINITY_DN8865_c0_g1_i3.p2  ORF type:complete len:161 (+),score=11.65 TRINITY_DN8865_c0_g1_i3:107-589(+)